MGLAQNSSISQKGWKDLNQIQKTVSGLKKSQMLKTITIQAFLLIFASALRLSFPAFLQHATRIII